MPGRVSRSSLPSRGPSTSKKATKKRKARGLNAFAIAQHEAPEKTKIKQHRLGEQEDEGPRKKRQRTSGDDDEEEEDEEDSSHAKRSQRRKGQSDDLDIDSGSDSEGHEWRLGVVADDDDSDLDSEEAFGESDEERFEGFSFRGSTGGKKQVNKKRVRKASGVEPDLDEDEVDGIDEEEDEDDLGEGAVDLAAMLDASEEESDSDDVAGSDQEVSKTSKHKNSGKEDEFGGFEEEDEAADSEEEDAPSEYDDDGEASDSPMSDAEDDNNPEKLKQLRKAVSSLAQDRISNGEATQLDNEDSSAAATRMLNALKGMSGVDAGLMKSVKKLSRDAGTTKTAKPNQMVKVPLPKRQQDRIDRGVAYDKAKETLNRWIDTVKHNRRAEHLSFPLQDPHAQEAQGTTRLLPPTASKPRTELESTIQDIMQASGLATNNGKSEEEQIRGFEELESNKMPLEEVLARRAELRKARDLLFREEARAKRIKKIKSKSFRRVHRKEAQREAQKERDLLVAAGVEFSEDEQEANDRRRAEERMGARHRESKWAKSIKQTGRAAWDEDARGGVADMARRNEELRMRMEGKRVRNEEESGSGSSDESDDDVSRESATDADGFKLRRQLDKVNNTGNDGTQSKLGALKFMQRADAARKQQNDADAERLRRELDGEESSSESERETDIGRKIFGPTETTTKQTPRPKRNELEEAESSASEDEGEGEAKSKDVINLSSQQQEVGRPQPKTQKSTKKAQLAPPSAKAKAFVPQHPSTTEEDASTSDADEPISTAPISQPRPSKGTAPSNSTTAWPTIQYTHPPTTSKDDPTTSSDAENENGDDPLIPSNHSLVLAAFGGDDVDASFAAEKDDAAASEDEKTVNTALPGWGSWTGSGVSKRSLKRTAQLNKSARFTLKTADGVRPVDRRDRKLKDVIISEKRIKKNGKYMAEKLPFPYESRQQYERSLRIPIGPEWTTKETFQAATKPRVVVQKGRVIKPMVEPMV